MTAPLHDRDARGTRKIRSGSAAGGASRPADKTVPSVMLTIIEIGTDDYSIVDQETFVISEHLCDWAHAHVDFAPGQQSKLIEIPGTGQLTRVTREDPVDSKLDGLGHVGRNYLSDEVQECDDSDDARARFPHTTHHVVGLMYSPKRW